MTGKEKCRALREMREKIAGANEISLTTDSCTHEGPCPGTCPRCEQEALQLDAQLQRRASLGKKIALIGLCAGMLAAATGCAIVEKTAVTAGATPSQSEPLAGDVAVDPELVLGEIPMEPNP